MVSENITLAVNGEKVEVEPQYHDWTLLRYLRQVLGLTGVKKACDNEGTCGTCTVIVDGRALRACLTRMSSLKDKAIETIESLIVEDDKPPHPIIQTVAQDGIFQCGYCAPGAIMKAKALLDQTQDPSPRQISSALSSVICRCVGLNRMDKSVQRAAAIMRGEAESVWTPEDSANRYMLLEKLTGVLKYTDDLSFPDMAYAKVLRANVPHARMQRIDIEAAKGMPGVLHVLTAADVPGENLIGLDVADQPVLCEDEIRYVGDPLAVVVAETEEAAQKALEAIQVELEPLPVVDDPREALHPESPVLHAHLREEYPDTPNLLKHYAVRKGDWESGFEGADVIIEDDYQVPFVEHAFMEIETSIAVPEQDGTITVYVGSQGPTDDRRQIAAALGVDESAVNVAHMYLGGGFGGKEDIAGQIHAALAAHYTGRPVNLTWDRAESLWVHPKRHAAQMHYKMGAGRDGRLVAAEIKVYGDTGAYASVGEAVLFRCAVFACGPYNVPHAKVDSYAVHTNNVPGGAFRGFGSPQVAFAAEIHMNKLAEALGIDPYKFRMRNALDYGDATITGDVLNEVVSAAAKPCLKAVKEALDKTPVPEVGSDEKIGIGFGLAYKNVGLGSNIPDGAGAKVELTPDGCFLVRHGAADMGQGANEAMAHIAARTLGVPLKMVRVHTGDTRVDPSGGMTTASKATFVTGNAALQASQALRDDLWRTVSSEFSVDPEELVIREGQFVNKESRRVYLSLQELANGGVEFARESHYHAPQTQPIPEYSPSDPEPPEAPLHFAYGYGAQGAVVAVNQKTGEVRVLKLVAAHDVGAAISVQNVIGQIEGAAIQGMGYALSEDFPVEDGIPAFSKFMELGLLRTRDLPEIEPIIIEDPHPFGPYGAKGMGELAISPTAPAIANAIHDAVGAWVNSLPITKEKVLEAIRARSAGE